MPTSMLVANRDKETIACELKGGRRGRWRRRRVTRTRTTVAKRAATSPSILRDPSYVRVAATCPANAPEKSRRKRVARTSTGQGKHVGSPCRPCMGRKTATEMTRTLRPAWRSTWIDQSIRDQAISPFRVAWLSGASPFGRLRYYSNNRSLA